MSQKEGTQRNSTQLAPCALHNLKGLLQLDHELPVVLAQIVLEELLAGVDAGATNLAHQLVCGVKVPTVELLVTAVGVDLWR